MMRELLIREHYVDWILVHRVRLLTLIGLVTALAVICFWPARLRVSVLQGLMSDRSQVEQFRERAELFGGASDDLIYVATTEGPQLFSVEKFRAIRLAARELEASSEIKRVVAITDLPRVNSLQRRSAREVIGRTILRNKLARGEVPVQEAASQSLALYWPKDHARQRQVDFAVLRREMLQDSLASRLLSSDGDSQAMLIWLDGGSDLHNLPQTGIRQLIRSTLARHQLGADGFYCAGTLVIQDWMFGEALLALKVVLPVTAGVMALLVYLIFRRVSYVLLNLLIAGIAILWTLGVAAIMYGEITLLVAATPALVLIISTADTIHLTSAYVAELESGLRQDQAIRKMFREVGGACLLTSVTTLVGFLSLMVVPAVMVRQMALACAVGVASALLLALALVPVALTVLKPPKTHQMATSRINLGIDRAVSVCRQLSLRHPRIVVLVHAMVMTSAVVIALPIQFDADLPARFRSSHPLRESIEFFNRQFMGTTAVELFVKADPDTLFSPELTVGLEELERQLKSDAEVRDVVSVVTLYRMVKQLIGVNDQSDFALSPRFAEAAYRLVAQNSPLAARSVAAPQAGLLRIIVQVTPTSVLTVLDDAERMEEIARGVLPEEVSVTSSGYCSVIGQAVRVVLVSQAQGLLICLVSVTCVLMIGIGSVRLSLLALFPNILPLVLLGAILKLSFDVVDTDVLAVAIVSFGLAVDDTIHFLHRYDTERRRTSGSEQALQKTFSYTGRAIVRTTIILSLGLLPFGLSGYLSIRMLGTYLVFVLGCAVLGDLLLLPSLVLLFDRQGKASAGGRGIVGAKHGAT
jgi:predicted RND superfamily exporter protein